MSCPDRALPVRRALAALLAVLLLAGLAACNGEASREPGGQTWPTGEPLDSTGLVWGKGHIVHFGDGTEIDTVDDFSEYAVAGDSVWFTKAAPSDPTQPADNGRLHRATRDGVEATDSHVTQFTATADGRHLVFLDDVNGPKDDDGTAAYLLVVIDTETGEETIRTSEGMDESGAVGLAEAYEEGSPWLVAVTDDTAYVRAMGEYRAFDLVSGEVDGIDVEDVPDLHSEEPDPRPNPSGEWHIDHSRAGLGPVFVGPDGASVSPAASPDGWSLSGWLDDDTAVGYATHLDETRAVITCEVPSGKCREIARSTFDPLTEPAPLPQRAVQAGEEQ